MSATGLLGSPQSLAGRLVLGAPLLQTATPSLSATSSGTSSTSATLQRARGLQAVANGTGSATAALSRIVAFRASTVGSANAQGVLSALRALRGSVAGLSTAAVFLIRVRTLSAVAAQGSSTAAAHVIADPTIGTVAIIEPAIVSGTALPLSSAARFGVAYVIGDPRTQSGTATSARPLQSGRAHTSAHEDPPDVGVAISGVPQ